MINFPNISPDIFSFHFLGFSFTLRWYAVSYIVGFVCAIKLMKHLIKRDDLWVSDKPPLKDVQADSLLTYLILGVILGGRIGYVLFYNFPYYAVNPIDILRIWDGGMAFHGGFLGVCCAVIIYCWANSISIWSGADLVAVASPPGLFFGRLANFINGELWGRPTELPWGVIFRGDRAQNCLGFGNPCARHPTQLYEAFFEGFLLFLLLYVCARMGAFKKPGLITGLFALGYGLSRFFIEYFRVPDPQFLSISNPHGFVFNAGEMGITMGQTLSLPMIVVGLVFCTTSLIGTDKENLR